MFQRLRRKLTLLAVAIAVSLYLVSSFTVYFVVRSVVIRNADQQLATFARQIAPLNASRLPSLPNNVIIYKNRKGIITTNAGAALQRELQTIAADARTRRFKRTWVNPKGVPFRILYVADGRGINTSTYIFAVMDLQREFVVLKRLQSVFLIVGGFGVILATISGFFLAWRALRPVRDAWQRQVEFVADASHELRTPLAVIQSSLGVVMEHSHQSVLDNMEWINNAHSESRRLTRLVDNLLTLARGDSQKLAIQSVNIHLSDLAKRICELFQPLAEAKSIRITCDIAPEVYMMGDPDRIHQLLVIVLDNALKFTPVAGNVGISLALQRANALLTITDTGKGITKDALPRVFDRFYQEERARERSEHAGAGLGLSIAKWIVDAHRGKITITSKLGHGTEVHIEFHTASQTNRG